MSGYRGHLVGGVVAYAIAMPVMLTYHTPPPLIGLCWFICALAGSLFPDIDIKSKGQQLFYWLMLILIAFLIAQKKMVIVGWISLASMIPLLVKHRGIFHAFWFVIVCPGAVAWAISIQLPVYTVTAFSSAYFFAAGAISHLYLDFGLWDMVRWY